MSPLGYLMKRAIDYDITHLLAVMTHLRHPEYGCPWDLEQDFQSLLPLIMEETAEVADAIQTKDFANLREELGDLLLHIALYTQLASEAGYFDFAQVVDELVKKLVRRHPHVFLDGAIDGKKRTKKMTANEASESWNAVKSDERHATKVATDPLDKGVPRSMPSLARAQKVQKRAAKRGFDWQRGEEGVQQKLFEEFNEFNVAESPAEREKELGDLLFTCVNLARHHGVDAETALMGSTRRFIRRVQWIQNKLYAHKSDYRQLNGETCNHLWEQAKLHTYDGEDK